MATTAERATILAIAVGPDKDFLIDSESAAAERLDQVRPYIRGLIDALAPRKRLGTDFVIVYKEREPADLDKTVAQAVNATTTKISLIFPMSTTALHAAMKATTSIPIVFPSISDPAADGVVKEGNATGVSASRTQTAKDCRDRFIALVPTLKTVYALHKSGYGPATRALPSVLSPGPVVVEPLAVQSRQEIQQKISSLTVSNPGEVGILVLPSDLMFSAASEIVEAAHKRGIPTFFPITHVVRADGLGALAGYGVPQHVCGELAADYVHKILWEGKRPQDLPVKTADRFECVVSRKAAAKMKITINAGPDVKQI
jgi:putative ABC transport system substrate-binding protein